MPLNDTDLQHDSATDANLDNAKWDGDELLQAAWLRKLDEAIEADSAMRTFVNKGIVTLANGKVAVDSKAAISAIATGTAKKLHARTGCATPFPPGEYLDEAYTEAEAADALRSPTKYKVATATYTAFTPVASAADALVKIPDELKDTFVVQPFKTDELNEKIAHFVYARISDRQKVREYKKTCGADGRHLLALLHEEVRDRSLLMTV